MTKKYIAKVGNVDITKSNINGDFQSQALMTLAAQTNNMANELAEVNRLHRMDIELRWVYLTDEQKKQISFLPKDFMKDGAE